jgi:segregation and condensation protein A
MEYRVELDVYHGPLDLLLYLIRRDELDIHDIPIARITDSYMAYLQNLRGLSQNHGIDIDLAGEFLVMAATLMEIKSAMLLPRPPAEEGAAAADLTDPRYELVQKLLEYKRFKDAAADLERRQLEHRSRFARTPARAGQADEPPPLDLDEVQVWDLLEAFQRLLAEVGMRRPQDHEVVYDDTPLDLHAADILDRLKREGRLSFRKLIEGRPSRSEMIGLFLALLELIRQRQVLIQQAETGGEITIEPAPEEHRAGLHLTAETQAPDEPAAAADAPSPAAPEAVTSATGETPRAADSAP